MVAGIALTDAGGLRDDPGGGRGGDALGTAAALADGDSGRRPDLAVRLGRPRPRPGRRPGTARLALTGDEAGCGDGRETATTELVELARAVAREAQSGHRRTGAGRNGPGCPRRGRAGGRERPRTTHGTVVTAWEGGDRVRRPRRCLRAGALPIPVRRNAVGGRPAPRGRRPGLAARETATRLGAARLLARLDTLVRGVAAWATRWRKAQGGERPRR
ncbi:hypothetical protein ACRAWF_21780 [Streptomyces sp. L7]